MAYTNINKSSDYFNTALWTTDGTGNKALTTGHSTDMVWIKFRDFAYDHRIYDDVRGVTKKIIPNSTGAESTSSDVASFDANGFTVSSNLNTSGEGGLVGWSWKANGSGSSNTDGSITSTVSANTTSGFSIVKWNGQTGTVGHGLGAKPAFIVVKCLGISNSWVGTHQGLGTNMSDNYIILNSSNASGSTNWGGEPTSSVFSINSNVAENNDNIAYCFAEKQGFSKFGSYVGNGNADGAFVYTGFKPAFLLIRSVSTTNWNMFDNKRSSFNVADETLWANSTNSEATVGTSYGIDILSNGFKAKTVSSQVNNSNTVHIYMAFAEAPLVGTNNVPCTAR